MKLQELDARRPTEQIAKTLRGQYESQLDFDRLSESQARRMLGRVKDLLKEHRSSVSRHFSERNPDYMKLVMLEQALTARVKEKPVARRVMEASEVQTAQVVMAAQDLVDKLQDMMEEVSEMQFKNIPAVTDAIKNEIGTEQASQFQSQASASLATLLTAVQGAKTEMEAAQGVLTGQAPTVPGAEAGAMPAVEPGAEPVPGEEEMDLSLSANLPGEDEEEADAEAGAADLGRERR